MARLLDLKAAYKQMPVSSATRWAGVISVTHPETGIGHLYVSEVLPFGASAAVFGFSRVAQAIRKVGSRIFGLIWTIFFSRLLST